MGRTRRRTSALDSAITPTAAKAASASEARRGSAPRIVPSCGVHHRREDRQVGEHPEQPCRDQQPEVLVVEDPVLVRVIAFIAAAEQQVAEHVRAHRVVAGGPVGRA